MGNRQSLNILLNIFIFMVNFISFAGTFLPMQPPASTSSSRDNCPR